MEYLFKIDIANKIRIALNSGSFVDTSKGAEKFINALSRSEFDNAVKLLVNEGYPLYKVSVKSIGANHNKVIRVVDILCPKGSTEKDAESKKYDVIIVRDSGYTDLYTTIRKLKGKGYYNHEIAKMLNISEAKVVAATRRD